MRRYIAALLAGFAASAPARAPHLTVGLPAPPSSPHPPFPALTPHTPPTPLFPGGPGGVPRLPPPCRRRPAAEIPRAGRAWPPRPPGPHGVGGRPPGQAPGPLPPGALLECQIGRARGRPPLSRRQAALE